MNRLLLAALQPHVAARIVEDSEGAVLPPRDALCFAAPSAGEIVVDNAKLVASAVWRDHEGFLQQGSILTQGDQEPLRLLTNHDAPQSGQVATLAGLNATTSFDIIAASLADAFGNEHEITTVALDAGLQRAAELRVNHFSNPLWLWRR